MKSLTTRGLILTVAMLSVLAVAAAPAFATLTPAGGAVAATSTNSQLTEGGISVRCPRSDLRGRIAANGLSATGTATFTGDGRTTCVESFLGSSVTVTCTGTITITSTSSVAGTSASGDLTLDSGYRCTIRSLAGTRTIDGPQTIRGCVTFTQARQTLNVNCAGIRTSTGTATFSGSYALSTRVTIS